MSIYERFAQKTAEQMEKIKHLIGNTYMDSAGRVLVLHSCNDLGVLYFTKPGGKTEYFNSELRVIGDLEGREVTT